MEAVESVVTVLSEVCFNEILDVDRSVLHSSLLDNLERALLVNGFEVLLEAPQKFNYEKIKDHSVNLRQGYIDLAAKKGDLTIGIEFDSAKMLRYKSIEKLIQSPYTLCIGIVKGNNYSAVQSDLNQQRIKSALSKSELKNKIFLFINLSQKSITRFG